MLQKKQNIFLKNYLFTKNLMIKLLIREVEKLETLRLKEEYNVLLDEFIKQQQSEAQQSEPQQSEAQQSEPQQSEPQQSEPQQSEGQQSEGQQTFISEEDFLNIELKKLNLKNLSKVDIFNKYPLVVDKSLIVSELEYTLDLTQADRESFLENKIQNEYPLSDFFSKISPFFNPYFIPQKTLSSFSILSIVKLKKKKK